MRGCKRYISIVCCSAILYAGPAKSFWPVLDFGEIQPVVSDVTNSLQKLSQVKAQLDQINETMVAIGNLKDTIAQFSADLRNTLNEIADIVDDAVDVVNTATGANIHINDSIRGAIDKVNNAQSGIVDGLSQATDNVINKGTGITDNITGTINKAQAAGKDAQDFLDKQNKKPEEDNKEKEENKKEDKNFWDKVKDTSNKIDKATDKANDVLDKADKAGINTGGIRDTINDINDAQKGAVNKADNAKDTAEDLKGDIKDFGNIGKGDKEGKEDGDGDKSFWDKVGDVSDKASEAAGKADKVLEDVGKTGIVDTDGVRDTLGDINKAQENTTQAAEDSKDFVDGFKGGKEGEENNESGEGEKNFWDKVGDVSNKASESAGKADKILEDVGNTGIIDTGGVRDTLGDINKAQENATQAAEDSKDFVDGFKGGKEREENNESGEGDKSFWDKVGDVSNTVSDAAGKADALLEDVGNTGIVDTNGVRDTINDVNNKQTEGVQKGEDYLNKQAEKQEAARREAAIKEAQEKARKEREERLGIGGQVAGSEIVEEEEEEEEISEETEAMQEEIDNNIKVVRDESAQLVIQLNDMFDTALNELNSAMEMTSETMNTISDAVARAENINILRKKLLQVEIKRLLDKQQATSDKAVSIMENMKEDYNHEYQVKLVDNLDNYEKVINQYMKGDVDKKVVKEAGENLKREVASINVMPDKSVMDDLANDVASIQKEILVLRDKIKEAEQKTEN